MVVVVAVGQATLCERAYEAASWLCNGAIFNPSKCVLEHTWLANETSFELGIRSYLAASETVRNFSRFTWVLQSGGPTVRLIAWFFPLFCKLTHTLFCSLLMICIGERARPIEVHGAQFATNLPLGQVRARDLNIARPQAGIRSATCRWRTKAGGPFDVTWKLVAGERVRRAGAKLLRPPARWRWRWGK